MTRTRILVVDDDAGVRFALSRLLAASGDWEVAVAADADEAEALIARGAAEVMVLDLHLHGMRGDAFFHRACEMQPSLAHRTLMITGDVSPMANDAMCTTGCRYLMKPFLASKLLAAVGALAEGLKGRRERSA